MNIGQAILALVEADGLSTFGPALGTFLAAEAAANGDPVKTSAAYLQLQGNLVAAAPMALGELQSQLATALATRLAAKLPNLAAQAQQAQQVLAGTVK